MDTYATGQAAGGARAPRIVGGAPLRRDTQTRLRWPATRRTRDGIVVYGQDADACAVAVLAVESAWEWRRECNYARRQATKAERAVNALASAVDRGIAAAPAYVIAGRQDELTDVLARATEQLRQATVARDAWRERAAVSDDAAKSWQAYVVLPDRRREDAYATEVAYAWAARGGNISTRLRQLRTELSGRAENARRLIKGGSNDE